MKHHATIALLLFVLLSNLAWEHQYHKLKVASHEMRAEERAYNMNLQGLSDCS